MLRSVNFCGRGSHYVQECNDMEVIYRKTVVRGILLIGLSKTAVAAARASGRALRCRARAAA